MTKCNVCGKFVSATGVAVVACGRCNAKCHKTCQGLDTSAPKDWSCSSCVATSKVPQKFTPAKSGSNEIPTADTQQAVVSNTADGGACPPSSQAAERQNLASPISICREETIAELISEIRMFREDLRKNRSEMATFRQEMLVLKDDIIYCKTNVGRFEQELLSMNERILELERERTETHSLQSTIDQLKCDLNDRDQDLLINDIEIMNIPESNNENLYHLLGVLAATLGTTCTETDIVETFRAGPRRLVVSGAPPPAHPRPVIVRVTRRAVKDRLLRAARVRRNVTTSDMSLPGTPTKIYLNERLTKENRRLFKKAKEEGKRLNWRFVWTKYGKTYARKTEGSRIYSLRSDNDIARVFQSDVHNPPSEGSEQPNNSELQVDVIHSHDISDEPVLDIDDGQNNVPL